MSSRHPARLAVYAQGTVYYPRELSEADGKLYIVDEDGTVRILNDYKITTIQDGDGNTIDTIDPLTQKDLRLPNATEVARGMVKLGNTAPKAATDTASKGSSDAVSREDHTHPKQTDISGNAGTATKFKESQDVELTGDVTGSASSTGGWSIATTLKTSGVTAGEYGPTKDAAPAHGATFTVPQITVDAKGRVTSAVDRTITLPAGYTHPTSGVTAGTYGPDADATPDYEETFVVPVLTTDSEGHITSAAERTIKLPVKPTFELEDVGTEGSYGPTDNVEDYTFTVPSFDVDAKGRVTGASDKTITIPSKSKEIFEATLDPSTAYNSGTTSPFVYTLAVSGILAAHNLIVDLVLSDDYIASQEELSEFGKIYNIETHDGYITISATDELRTDLPIKLKFVCI